MEIWIVFFVLLIAGVVLFPLFVLGGAAGISSAAKRNAVKSLGRKDEILAGLFDGRPAVTYRVNLESLPFALVVESAPLFGYALSSQDTIADSFAKDLVFTKTS